MLENTNAPVFDPPTANWLPGGRLVGDLLPEVEEAGLKAVTDRLIADGEDLSEDGLGSFDQSQALFTFHREHEGQLK